LVSKPNLFIFGPVRVCSTAGPFHFVDTLRLTPSACAHPDTLGVFFTQCKDGHAVRHACLFIAFKNAASASEHALPERLSLSICQGLHLSRQNL
jgi:hypothetical protein